MIYVALLRGINVGGNSKVEMAKLKLTFERLGFSDVKTYINSGNVIFKEEKLPQAELASLIEKSIEADFGLSIRVLVRQYQNICSITKELPPNWLNDKSMKCDVLFLWEEIDKPDILKQLVIKPELEDVKYVNGAIIWRVNRENITRSGLMKLAGTDLYKKMTARNCNTVRKLEVLMNSLA